MGASESLSLCSVPPPLRPFTAWTEGEVGQVLARVNADTHTLTLQQFVHLLSVSRHAQPDKQTLTTIFTSAFAPKGQRVDVFEVLCAVILLSNINSTRKLYHLYGVFCFNRYGYTSHNDIRFMIHAVFGFLRRMDPSFPAYSNDQIEAYIQRCFPFDGSTTRDDFIDTLDTDAFASSFLHSFPKGLFHSASANEPYKDAEFPHRFSSIAPSCGEQRRLMLPPLQLVRWRSIDTLFTHERRKSKSHRGFEYSGAGALGRGAVTQGLAGSLWLANALTSLLGSPDLVERLFLTPLTHRRVCLQLFCQTRWSVCAVDSFVPLLADCETTDDELDDDAVSARIFCSSSDAAEAWPGLLAKAMAKLGGCYASLSAGGLEWGLRLLTGGHVRQRKTEEFKWTHNDMILIAHDSTYGARQLLDWLALGSLVSFMLTESAAIHRGLLGSCSYSLPPSQSVFPLLGVELVNGDTEIVLLDKWGWLADPKAEHRYKGLHRSCRVKVREIVRLFDVMVVVSCPDLVQRAVGQRWSSSVWSSAMSTNARLSTQVFRLDLCKESSNTSEKCCSTVHCTVSKYACL